MNRTASLGALAVASLVPAGGLPLLAAAPATAGPRIHVPAAGKLVTGSSYHMKWGDVRVRIRLNAAGTRIVNIGATAPTERRRSKEINDRALPTLRSEALQAQSSRIHSVSGATMTSGAYKSSLGSAIAKAHL